MNIDYQILDRLNNVPESEDFVGEVPYEIAVAKDDSENIDARIKSAFAEQDKIVDEFIKDQEDESRFVEADKKYEPKKLTLSESLFEDYNDEPDTYNRIFEILDNIAHVSQASMDWTDEEWTKEAVAQTAEIIDENVKELNQIVDTLEESLTEGNVANKVCESKTRDFESDIYNALADVMLKYKDEDIDPTTLDQAIMNFADRFFAENDLDEAWTFDEPTTMGRGQCAPLCPDYNESIDDALHELDDDQFADLAKRNLRRYLHELFDKKEEVENFNTYWTIRYPACIDFLDEQIEKIPEDIRKMVRESCDCYECEELNEESAEDAPIFKPKKKRDPLADIIQDELTIGEYGYRKTKNGTYVPANGPSVGLDVYDIGVDSDDKGYFIVANVANEDKVNKVIEVANKYSRDYVKEKGDSKRPYRIKIYMKEEDFDQPYIA